MVVRSVAMVVRSVACRSLPRLESSFFSGKLTVSQLENPTENAKQSFNSDSGENLIDCGLKGSQPNPGLLFTRLS